MISQIQVDNINYLKFEFRDSGRGIPDYRKDRLLKEIYKGETSKRGMGIGLFLVKKILDRFGGKIWVEDLVKGDYKRGSNFIIVIKEAH
jgi:signal transduction histidine kinase